MAYEVTATRRRPRQFEDLAGQEYVAETLKNSIKTKQIAHAYLFTGPRGCGKTSTARILAKALNCQSSEGPTCAPCGECESCRSITNSSSLDVIEIDGASTNSVNDVRQIKDEVMFPPASARYKIYIIDEVHMLSSGAFNALLKTIEEPPAHVIFIFATTELQKVPATIKSRCQQYSFRLVSVERLKALLSDACSEMNINADDEALYWIAKESGGSVRDCYTLFDQIAAFSQGEITYEKIRDKLGLLGIERLNALFEGAASGKTEKTLNQLDEFLQSGISIEQIIANSSEYLRSVLLLKNGIRKESLLGQSAERFSSAVLDAWNTVQTERALSIFMQLYRDIRYSLSPRYELELAFSKLCWLSEYVSPSELKDAISRAKALLASDLENSSRESPRESSGEHFSEQVGNSVSASNGGAQPEGACRLSHDANTNVQSQSNGGLPRFSFLENPPVREKKNFGNGGEEEFQNPFSDGGALPPKNTEAAENSEGRNCNTPEGMPTFSILKKEAEKNVQPASVLKHPAAPRSVRTYDEGYSYAPENEFPDSDDDGYSDTCDEPESLEARGEILLEEHGYGGDLDKNAQDLHSSQERIFSDDGSSVTVEKLYGTVVAELAVNNAMLASALMETKEWIPGQNKITTKINTEYQKNFIQQNIQTISQAVSKICRKPMTFEILYEEEKINAKAAELPVQVTLLCNAFKGTVVGGKL